MSDAPVKVKKDKRADLRIRRSLKPVLVGVPNALVRYHKDHKMFTGHASELSHAGHHFCSMVILLNPTTAKEVQFDLVQLERTSNNEVRTWTFKSVDPVGFDLVIHNT